MILNNVNDRQEKGSRDKKKVPGALNESTRSLKRIYNSICKYRKLLQEMKKDGTKDSAATFRRAQNTVKALLDKCILDDGCKTLPNFPDL